MDFLDLRRSMNIVNTLPEYTKPKNVGLMFFSLEPDRFFPYTQIDVVQFPEDLGGDQIIEKIFKGSLRQQLREALQYIWNCVIQEKVIKFSDRAEEERFFNYPYAAIKESRYNAVYHKGYDVHEPIEVRILPNRIEIVSHPGTPVLLYYHFHSSPFSIFKWDQKWGQKWGQKWFYPSIAQSGYG